MNKNKAYKNKANYDIVYIEIVLYKSIILTYLVKYLEAYFIYLDNGISGLIDHLVMVI